MKIMKIMKIKKLLLILGVITVNISVNAQESGNIGYGTASALGGGLFFGADGSSSVDSVSIGYFANSTAANIGLNDWISFGINTTPVNPGFFNGTVVNVDFEGEPTGQEAWLLINAGTATALVRENSWSAMQGAAPPTPTPSNVYIFDLNTISGNITTITDDTLTITDGGGYGGGQGVSLTLAPIPEPSTYAVLAGLLAFGLVATHRRRRA
jgi:hypothetical protein